jgi:hypothetical protein
MRTAFITCLALSLTLALAPAALAKSKRKSTSGGITGVYCAQGPDNAYFPASSIKPSVRKQLRKGQKVRFNYPGYGPISCVTY